VSAPAVAAGPGGPAVRARGLTRDYGGTGLLGVDLDVPRDGVFGLVGPNGSGKTTFLSLVTGLRRPDAGTVELGVDPARVAVSPDVPEFEPWLTAREVVDLARALVAPRAGPDRGGRGDAVAEALAVAGLADAADRRVGGFSRGMTQRLSLAAALVGDPELLVLDEPTSALDPAGRAEVLDLVAGMAGRRTVVFSSHILADVQRVADTLGVLRGGRLLYDGPTAGLLDAHLRPAWRLRVRGDAGPLATALRAAGWVTAVREEPGGALRVETVDLAAGETRLAATVAATGARLVALEPVDADLESAFLALTGGGRAA